MGNYRNKYSEIKKGYLKRFIYDYLDFTPCSCCNDEENKDNWEDYKEREAEWLEIELIGEVMGNIEYFTEFASENKERYEFNYRCSKCFEDLEEDKEGKPLPCKYCEIDEDFNVDEHALLTEYFADSCFLLDEEISYYLTKEEYKDIDCDFWYDEENFKSINELEDHLKTTRIFENIINEAFNDYESNELNF